MTSYDTFTAPDTVTLYLALNYQTPAALQVSHDGDASHAVWLPKSQCTFEHDRTPAGARRGVQKDGQVLGITSVTVTLPRWLAKEKGLI